MARAGAVRESAYCLIFSCAGANWACWLASGGAAVRRGPGCEAAREGGCTKPQGAVGPRQCGGGRRRPKQRAGQRGPRTPRRQSEEVDGEDGKALRAEELQAVPHELERSR